MTASLVAFLAVFGPLTAALIDRQRVRLESLVAEKNNLIDRYAEQKKTDGVKIESLDRRLAVWEGRANPWTFWPPKLGEPRRRELMEKLFKHANATISKQLLETEVGNQQAARGYLALALLADGTGHSSDAMRNYQLARDQLIRLRDRNPERSDFAQAVAECDTALARLTVDKNREQAIEHLESARSTYERIAIASTDDAAAQIRWLETLLLSAGLADVEEQHQFLNSVAEINSSLPEQWPRSPDAIYQLACFLTQRDPLPTAQSGAEPTRPPRNQ